MKPNMDVALSTLTEAGKHDAEARHRLERWGTDFYWEGKPLSGIHYPLIGIALYLLLIFELKYFMRDRPPLSLKRVAALHNIILCVLSFAMCVGTVYELLVHSQDYGFLSVVCDREHRAMRGRLAIWMYIFYLSKYYELFDTVIMVLKKRRLNFLHVYHHCVVMPLFWGYMQSSMIIHWVLVVANSLVHVFMYYYYALATFGKTVRWKKYITVAQIIQFVIDLTATWPFPFLYFSAEGCSGSMRGWLFGQLIGASFFKLFRDFYKKTYSSGNPTHNDSRDHNKNVDKQPRLSARELPTLPASERDL